jgi:hypothetical protein
VAVFRTPVTRILALAGLGAALLRPTTFGTFHQEVRMSASGGLPSRLLVDRRGQVSEVFLGYGPEREAYMRDRARKLVED